MSWRRNGGMPDPRSAFHRATLSTESNADLISIYATSSCLLKSRCNSANNLKANMAFIVDRPAVKPDC